jgi:integrase-like protein
VIYDFKIHELRHTAASLAIQAGANIKALQNMLGHESAGLTLDRYGHLYGSDVEAVGVAINNLLITRDCGQNVATGSIVADLPVWKTPPSCGFALWSLGDSNP